MQNAETMLAIIHERGKKGLHLEDVYRQLFNPDLYLRAYGRIYRNAGAMTRGSTAETVDGMSLEKIGAIIDAIRHERYRWTPVRRTYIPKKNGKTAAARHPHVVGQAAARSATLHPGGVLRAAVQRPLPRLPARPRMPHRPAGYPDRTGRGRSGSSRVISKGALTISTITVLLSILREKIHDNRFLSLVENLLKAGYLEEWHYRHHPQRHAAGRDHQPDPLEYLPRQARQVRRTDARSRSTRRGPSGVRIRRRIRTRVGSSDGQRKAGRHEDRKLRQTLTNLPSHDPFDPGYRRLRYVRYADDFLLGFVGPRDEAEEIKAKLAAFLRDRPQAGTVPGEDLDHPRHRPRRRGSSATRSQAMHNNTTAGSINDGDRLETAFQGADGEGRRVQAGWQTRSIAPSCWWTAISRSWPPTARSTAGFVQYYMLAQNIAWFGLSALGHEDIAPQDPCSQAQLDRHENGPAVREYGRDHRTASRKCLKVVIDRRGQAAVGCTIRRPLPRATNSRAVIRDEPTDRIMRRTELLQRLLADKCELCGSTEDVQVHHVRKLADLKPHGQRELPLWVRVMAARRRKTLVVCGPCHQAIHAGRPTRMAEPQS